MSDIRKIDELNDLCEGVIAVPRPPHVDRAEVIRKTGEAFRRLMEGEVK